MKYLLDVNLQIAGIVQTHSLHHKAQAWLVGADIVLCPIVELGFLRIATHSKSAIGLTMERAREVLIKFASERNAQRIPDDLPALDSHPHTSDQVTDHYLANLAARHGFKLATLDQQIRHSSVELI